MSTINKQEESKLKKIEDVFFIGNQGKVQVQVHNSTNVRPRIAVILPNDPNQYMGSMDNPIVNLINEQFVKFNFTTIKMNFKGVGKSDGKFEGAEKELINITFLVDWILNNYNGIELWMCGFSFGAWAAMQIMMRRPEVTKFLIVAPLCNKYDFSFLSPCPIGGLIVHGTSDSITPVNALKDLVAKSLKQKKHNIQVKYIQNADHFFRNKEKDLANVISSYIETTIKEKIEDDNMDILI
ncbi:MAG: dienelactone hydrolase family protein [Rickettsiales bacterium]